MWISFITKFQDYQGQCSKLTEGDNITHWNPRSSLNTAQNMHTSNFVEILAIHRENIKPHNVNEKLWAPPGVLQSSQRNGAEKSTVGPHHFIVDIDEHHIISSLWPAICQGGSIQSLSRENWGKIMIWLLLNLDLMPNLQPIERQMLISMVVSLATDMEGAIMTVVAVEVVYQCSVQVLEVVIFCYIADLHTSEYQVRPEMKGYWSRDKWTRRRDKWGVGRMGKIVIDTMWNRTSFLPIKWPWHVVL